MSEVILEIKDLKKYFPLANGKTVKAVDGVSMKMYKGETLGLVGESGCGKSTIAYTVVGMYGATSGQVIYDNMDIVKKGYRRTLKQKGDIQIVFQDPGSSLNSRRTIEKSMEVPLDIHDKMSKEEKEKRVEELLEMVGLPKDYKNKMPRNIGGGERQLVSVARALATNPELIILDEPTSALDVSVQAKVISTLIELQKKLELSYLFITHDLSLMQRGIPCGDPVSGQAVRAGADSGVLPGAAASVYEDAAILHSGSYGGRGGDEARSDRVPGRDPLSGECAKRMYLSHQMQGLHGNMQDNSASNGGSSAGAYGLLP